MNGIVRKKKKTLADKVIGRVRDKVSKEKQNSEMSVVEVDETRTGSDDIAYINARRQELREAAHDYSDLTIYADKVSSD